MMMKRTDIESRLQDTRTRELREKKLSSLLQEFRICSAADTVPEEASSPSDVTDLPVNAFDFDLLDGGRIYHLRHIRQICIDDNKRNRNFILY